MCNFNINAHFQVKFQNLYLKIPMEYVYSQGMGGHADSKKFYFKHFASVRSLIT